MASSSSNSSLSLKTMLDKVKLNGTNYLDWDRNLRIVLKYERKEYVLDQAIPEEPANNAARILKDAYQKHLSDSIDVACIMLGCMESDLQEQFMEHSHDPYAMMGMIKGMFKERARIVRYNVLNELLSCKMSAGSSGGPDVLKMKGRLEHLNRLGLKLENEMAADVVLRFLSRTYVGFVMNYHMNDMDKTISELHGMLVTAEKNIRDLGSKDVLVVKQGTSFKRGAGSDKGKAPMHLSGKIRHPKGPNPPRTGQSSRRK